MKITKTLEKFFGKNYLTTLAGLLVAIGNILIPILQSRWPSWREIVFSVSFAIFGALAKAINVTGTGDNALTTQDIEEIKDAD